MLQCTIWMAETANLAKIEWFVATETSLPPKIHTNSSTNFSFLQNSQSLSRSGEIDILKSPKSTSWSVSPSPKESNQMLLVTYSTSPKIHQNSSTTCWVILHTNTQKQNMTYFGGCNGVFSHWPVIPLVSTQQAKATSQCGVYTSAYNRLCMLFEWTADDLRWLRDESEAWKTPAFSRRAVNSDFLVYKACALNPVASSTLWSRSLY